MPGTREIGALVVEMRADATKFVRGMDRSERAMKDTRRESGRLGKSLGGIRAGATRAVGIISGLATVATGVITAGTNQYGELARDILSTSESLGVSTGNVQALGRVYERLGQELVDVRTNLNDVSRALGEARQGDAAFQQLFRSVGVDYTQPAQNLLDTLLKIGPALDTVSGGRIFGEEDFARLSGFFANPSAQIAAARQLNSLSEQQLLTLREAFFSLRDLTTSGNVFAAQGTAAVQSFIVDTPAPAPQRRTIPIAAPEPFFATADVEFTRELEDALREVTDQTELTRLSFGQTAEEVARLTAQFDFANQSFEAHLTLQREIEDAAVTGDTIRVDNLRIELDALNATVAGRERLADAILEATAAQARLTEEQQRSAELAASLGGALGDALGGALTDFKDIDQIGLQFLSTLISIVAQAALLGPLTRGLESGNFAGGIFDLFTAQTGGLHRGLGIVGEGGAELVDFSTPARVYSNDDLASALGGRGSGQGGNVYNITGLDETGIRAVLYQEAPRIEGGIRAGISEDAGRPSHFRNRLQGRV